MATARLLECVTSSAVKLGRLASGAVSLYTDNFYTSVALAIHMFKEYGWTIVGTIVPTDKKSREDRDIPFLKLSNGARLGVERGWFREAALRLMIGRKEFCIQCTTWRDKKQVCFLSSNQVGFSEGLTVRRHVKGQQLRSVIAGPRAQRDYVTYFNAVDKSDRDSADWSTSIRTNRYYIRIFCWLLDRVVHTIYVVVVFCVRNGLGKGDWSRYTDKNFGRPHFQVDLGLQLMNYGLGLDCKGGKRPDYMRASGFVPCDCKKCFFCLNGRTSGIRHARDETVTVEYKCGTRKRTKKCSRDRVDLQKGGSYCRMCFRASWNTEGTAAQRRRKCNSSRLGCPVCKEHICTACWEKGYDKHNT